MHRMRNDCDKVRADMVGGMKDTRNRVKNRLAAVIREAGRIRVDLRYLSAGDFDRQATTGSIDSLFFFSASFDAANSAFKEVE